MLQRMPCAVGSGETSEFYSEEYVLPMGSSSIELPFAATEFISFVNIGGAYGSFVYDVATGTVKWAQSNSAYSSISSNKTINLSGDNFSANWKYVITAK